MEIKRTVVIAGVLAVIVAGTVTYLAQEPPMDESQTRAYEARCMTAYTEWLAKKLPSPRELVECEKHYTAKGDTIQASFFASARRGRGS
ncbi:hypothetical protein [Roseiterribacter gracilis]|uniref:Uncharacterized protein n=1 Tax=Roseiterribacter gracilis TaxID=2812848 RepID=A0A8S8XEN9_9PROT|nr:hypothetical protein TMPK1_40900 [Rhodospirillales bacterium TMPK1]